jgi:CheY-like chemotaxis protein
MKTGLVKKRGGIPKIILVDDEEWFQEYAELLIRKYCNDVSLLKFRNRDEAWQEITRANPDLLITDLRNDNIPGPYGPAMEDLGISGFEMLRLLAARKVIFPILVVSGSLSVSGMEGLAKQCAGSNLKTSYVTKPFTEELFFKGLRKCLGPSSHLDKR